MTGEGGARDTEHQFPPIGSYFEAFTDGVNEIIEAYGEVARQTAENVKATASIMLWWRSRGFVSALEKLEMGDD